MKIIAIYKDCGILKGINLEMPNDPNSVASVIEEVYSDTNEFLI